MTAANHLVAGAIIGSTINEPVLALPLAFLSHFVLDRLPHFGFDSWEDRTKHKLLLNIVLVLDGIILLTVFTWLWLLDPGWLVIACGLVAASPDLAWVYRFTIMEKFGRIKPPKGNWLTEFHSRIQIYEFKEGLIVDYPVLIFLIWVLNNRV